MSAHGFLNVSRLMWIHACTCHISDEKAAGGWDLEVSIMMFSLGRCCLLDFSLVVGDVSRHSLSDTLSFEAFPDQLQVSVMSIRRLV